MSSQLNLNHTLAIIKPHAIRHRSSILRRIQMAGFHVLQERCVKLTVEQSTTFMCLHKSSDCRENLSKIESLCSGPLIALVLARSDAVEMWKQLMGPESCSAARKSSPTSLRALYGVVNDDVKNAVHGSHNEDDVKHELLFFFPNMVLDQHFDFGHLNEYLCAVLYQPLSDSLYNLVKIKPDDPLEWLANFMLECNSNKPKLRETNLNVIQKLKEFEEYGRKQHNFDGPLACGCYLSKASSVAQISIDRCCKNFH